MCPFGDGFLEISQNVIQPEHFVVRRPRNTTGPKYTKLQDVGDCRYCGEASECWDHAASYIWSMTSLPIPKGMQVLVPSCNSCNSLAGDHICASFGEKAQFILNRLRRKAKSLLTAPDWEDGDLDDEDFDERMRGYIEAQIFAKETLFRRLRNLEQVAESNSLLGGDIFVSDIGGTP